MTIETKKLEISEELKRNVEMVVVGDVFGNVFYVLIKRQGVFKENIFVGKNSRKHVIKRMLCFKTVLFNEKKDAETGRAVTLQHRAVSRFRRENNHAVLFQFKDFVFKTYFKTPVLYVEHFI